MTELIRRDTWHVLPVYHINRNGVCSCHLKDRCRTPGKHPTREWTPHGVHDASAEQRQIDEWIASGAQSWAVATGPKSDLLVVDIDLKTGGYQS